LLGQPCGGQTGVLPDDRVIHVEEGGNSAHGDMLLA
jgi:hypothetical protein